MIRSFIRAVAVLACVGTVGQAQLGGLIKRAAQKAVEKKVENKVEEKAESLTPVEPLAGDPLTAKALDAVLLGLSLEVESAKKTKELYAASEAKAAELTEAERLAANEPEVWRKASSDVMRCVDRSVSAAEEVHTQEAPQRMMALMQDPSRSGLVAKVQAAGKQMNDALAKKDMKAYQRATTEYMKLFGFDAAKDTAAAYVKCGKPPAKPKSLVTIERLQAARDTLDEQRRTSEDESGARAAKAAGMPADKYGLARERLWVWNVTRNRKPPRRGGLTAEEETLFSARAADIIKLESVLR